MTGIIPNEQAPVSSVAAEHGVRNLAGGNVMKLLRTPVAHAACTEETGVFSF
jgi:hypothetical protein